jgi:hypothetical protein
MLYWICPECGHECSPAIRECPTCTAAEKAASGAGKTASAEAQASSDILSLAQNFEISPALGVSVASGGAERSLIAQTNGHSAVGPAASNTAVLEVGPGDDAGPIDEAGASDDAGMIKDEDTVELVLSPSDRARLKSLVQPLVESAADVKAPTAIEAVSAALEPAVKAVEQQSSPASVAPEHVTSLAEKAEPVAAAATAKQAVGKADTESGVKPPAPVKEKKPAEKEPAASTELASLNAIALQPAIPPIAETLHPAVSPAAPRAVSPAVVGAKIRPVEYRLKPGELAPTGDVQFQAVPSSPPKAHEQAVEPAPSRRRSVAFLRQALPGGQANTLASADLTAPALRFIPAQPAGGGLNGGTAALPSRPAGLALVSSMIDRSGASLSELLHALETSAEELEQSAIRAIAHTFEERPAARLLCAPTEIVTAPAPPSEQWMRSPKLVFTARSANGGDLATISAGPQTTTLAGPCLPPQLRNFTESSNSNRRPPRKRAAAPTWMVSVIVAIGLFLGAGSLLQYLTANRDAKAASAAAAPNTQTTNPAPVPIVPVAREHPGARFVEVAGMRVVAAPNKRPQLQYIVINHSSGELTGLNIHIAVHSADSPGGLPLFSVAAIVPSLAPNQSKEIHTDLDAGLNASSIPDWQSLRPEILITRQ